MHLACFHALRASAGMTVMMASCAPAPITTTTESTSKAVEIVAFVPAAPLEMEPGSYGKGRRDRYNRVYAEAAPEMAEPNAFMLKCLDQIELLHEREGARRTPEQQSHRTALDIAMGEGRNTIAMAQRGYHVTGFDFSDVGVNAARQRAAELELEIDARVQSFKDFDFGIERWDVVTLMYFGVDDAGMRRITDSVKPGGHLIIERSGGDVNNDFLRQLAGWHILAYSQEHGSRDWASGDRHPEDGLRTQVFARKR